MLAYFSLNIIIMVNLVILLPIHAHNTNSHIFFNIMITDENMTTTNINLIMFNVRQNNEKAARLFLI